MKKLRRVNAKAGQQGSNPEKERKTPQEKAKLEIGGHMVTQMYYGSKGFLE
ncbi:unnamed protein product [Dovyalis caffra]|uniref:Uncharacterized protein n=1 Tax=Dovyalis caffra TaxID=77055 RepID=A0AAV1QWC8_9ROSI|nr:unnamed protein product [Dovyalis caffra]